MICGVSSEIIALKGEILENTFEVAKTPNHVDLLLLWKLEK